MQSKRIRNMPQVMIGIASLTAFAIWAPLFCVPPMEHILKRELVLTHTQTALLFIGPTLMMAALTIPGGLMADRIGIRKAAGIGTTIIAVGAILRGTASDFSSLLAFTLFYGIGLGLTFPNLPKLVSAWVQWEKVGMATGLFSAGLPAGIAVALAITMPIIFPITNSYQGVFFIWGTLPLIATTLWWVLVREPPRSDAQDHRNAKSDTLAMCCKVLRNRKLWVISSVFFLHNFFLYTWTGWAPKLIMLKGATANLAGLITSIAFWVGIPTSIYMPRLAYKLKLRKPFLWVPSIILAIAAWQAIDTNLSMGWLLMAVVGGASATRFPTIVALPVEMMHKEEVGTASGLVLSIGHIGAVIGPLIGGYILDISGSLELSLLILTGVSIATVGVSLLLPESHMRGTRRGDDLRPPKLVQ